MRGVLRFTTFITIGILLPIGVALGAGSTHAIGGSASDVRSIKETVAQFRHEAQNAIDWYIAVDGQYAVAYDGCGPGACDENQLIRRGSNWIVTCYTTEGKGQFGTCLTPRTTEQRLCRMALAPVAPYGDARRLWCQSGDANPP